MLITEPEQQIDLRVIMKDVECVRRKQRLRPAAELHKYVAHLKFRLGAQREKHHRKRVSLGKCRLRATAAALGLRCEFVGRVHNAHMIAESDGQKTSMNVGELRKSTIKRHKRRIERCCGGECTP